MSAPHRPAFDQQFARHTAHGLGLVLAAMTCPPYRSAAEHAHCEGLTIPEDDSDPRDLEQSEVRGPDGRYLSAEQADILADQANDRAAEDAL